MLRGSLRSSDGYTLGYKRTGFSKALWISAIMLGKLNALYNSKNVWVWHRIRAKIVFIKLYLKCVYF